MLSWECALRGQRGMAAVQGWAIQSPAAGPLGAQDTMNAHVL